MPKLRNGNNGDSNPGSLDCESGILPTELPRSTMVVSGDINLGRENESRKTDICRFLFQSNACA